MENIKWIFSGIGCVILSMIIGYILNRRNKNKKAKRTVNQFGEKSMYIEENKGDITIN